jgi:hypothetical protein
MIEAEVIDLLLRDPFEPFRVKLVNGDIHDIGNPEVVAVLEEGLYIASQDGNWAQFPFDRIASLESLIPLD